MIFFSLIFSAPHSARLEQSVVKFYVLESTSLETFPWLILSSVDT